MKLGLNTAQEIGPEKTEAENSSAKILTEKIDIKGYESDQRYAELLFVFPK